MTETQNNILSILSRYWGYTAFLPFQEEAIGSILDARDTLTVLPTGGGKSVCFQVPALIKDGTAVIVSPLISLMKDQVDYLKELGIAAEYLNSSLNAAQRVAVLRRLAAGELKLLYVSPERLAMPEARELLKKITVSFFVIDEAHCISHWGHDFRAEYRQLGFIKEEFPGNTLHAFTATATPDVQADIIAQLKLREPAVYRGSVDRPNLTYRVFPRTGNGISQIMQALKNHAGEPGIIYCLRRADVDEISEKLNALGFPNLPYHAGMPEEERKRNQDAFSQETVSLIVATIAFGMGIDRSNIRFVIHAAMPKSIEHYQQETGRAGRDRLAADCYLFFSGADYRTWEYISRDSSERDVIMRKLGAMYEFCIYPHCRHKFLVSYFGQPYEAGRCGACDYCLGELELVQDPLIVGQKVLSCVLRAKERFGANHIADILQGSATAAVAQWEHDKLSTFGIMKEHTKQFIRYMIEQLAAQGFLERRGEYVTLGVTASGRALLKGEVSPLLAKPVVAKTKKEAREKRKARRAADWQGVDEGLFEKLRAVRAELARQHNVPAYIVFGDKTLRDMAAKKPQTMEDFLTIYGVGEHKQKKYARHFLDALQKP